MSKARTRGQVLLGAGAEAETKLEYAPSHLPRALLQKDMDYDLYVWQHRRYFAEASLEDAKARFDRVRGMAAAEFKRFPDELKEWRFVIEETSRDGWCAEHRDHNQTIVMAPVFALIAPDADLKETILHEIAHALSPPALDDGDLHGKKWLAKAKEIGAQRPSVLNPIDIQLRPVLYRCKQHPESKWHFKRLVAERTAEMDATECPKCRGPLEAVRNRDNAHDKRVLAAAAAAAAVVAAVEGRCHVCEAPCEGLFCCEMCRQTHAAR